MEVRGWMAGQSLAGWHGSWQSLHAQHGKFNVFEHNHMKWSWSVRKKRCRRMKILSLCMEMALWTSYTWVQLVKWSGSTQQAVHKGSSARHIGKELKGDCQQDNKPYAFLVWTLEEGILQRTVIRMVEGHLVCALQRKMCLLLEVSGYKLHFWSRQLCTSKHHLFYWRHNS